jgi:hypothetical protein
VSPVIIFSTIKSIYPLASADKELKKNKKCCRQELGNKTENC